LGIGGITASSTLTVGGDIAIKEGHKFGFRYSAGDPGPYNWIEANGATPIKFYYAVGSTQTEKSFSFYTYNSGSIERMTLYNRGELRLPTAPTASANYGLVSLGSGAFDGSTSGFFTGSSSGTVLAVNAASGFAGNLIDVGLNVSGTYSSAFKVSAGGKVNIGKENGGGNGQYLVIPHNASTVGGSDATQGIWFADYGGAGYSWKMGSTGSGYPFTIKNFNGGQGTFTFDLGGGPTFALKGGSAGLQTYGGTWTISSGGVSGNYINQSTAFYPSSQTVTSDSWIVSGNNMAAGYYPVTENPIMSLFNGDVAGTVSTTNRFVARFNRLGFLGIGTTNTYATPNTNQQAAITVDMGAKTGYSPNNPQTTAMQVVTSGSSTTVSFLNGQNNSRTIGVMIGSKITANGVTRTVTNVSYNGATLDAAVNWDNGGAGYGFTYTNPYLSFQDGATKYFTVDEVGNTVIAGTLSASNVLSGTYTPTLTGVANVGASTARQATYSLIQYS